MGDFTSRADYGERELKSLSRQLGYQAGLHARQAWKRSWWLHSGSGPRSPGFLQGIEQVTQGHTFAWGGGVLQQGQGPPWRLATRACRGRGRDDPSPLHNTHTGAFLQGCSSQDSDQRKPHAWRTCVCRATWRQHRQIGPIPTDRLSGVQGAPRGPGQKRPRRPRICLCIQRTAKGSYKDDFSPSEPQRTQKCTHVAWSRGGGKTRVLPSARNQVISDSKGARKVMLSSASQGRNPSP